MSESFKQTQALSIKKQETTKSLCSVVLLYLCMWWWWILRGKWNYCADGHFRQRSSGRDNSAFFSDSYFSNSIKYVSVRKLNSSPRREKKKKKTQSKFPVPKVQPCAGCYPRLGVSCPFNSEQKMEKSDEDWRFVFHFLFLLFRAFHSPSWVPKLPKSSFTFLFLSASLKHKAGIGLEASSNRNTSQEHFGSKLRLIPTCSWLRWASLGPRSASPSWFPSERPWTPSCTCASFAPSLSPLWCCHASFRSPTWELLLKKKDERCTFTCLNSCTKN